MLDADENIGDLIPRCLVDNARRLQPENSLELHYRLLCGVVEIAGDIADFWNGGVVAGDAVQLHLNGADGVAAVSQGDIKAGVGRRVGADGGVGNDVDVLPVVVRQDFVGGHALLCQRHCAPLGESVAGDGGAVAKGGEKRFHIALPPDVAVEQFIHQLSHIFKDLTAVGVFLVELGGTGDVKGVSSGTVPLGVDAVQGKGGNDVDVGTQGVLRPCGVDLAGGNVFDVVRKGNGDIVRRLLRSAQMHRNGLRDVGFANGHRLHLLESWFVVLKDGWLRRIVRIGGEGGHGEDLP